ncbi:unnamed protein product [Phytophthora lilii]|uniref:Unnamed protein product n=1 Tax=Phytophthora lilii TaxID=2077276 RepID=A0A9W6XEW6_9STRA|nr:unnamed protein product [Phytophthora lilii]
MARKWFQLVGEDGNDLTSADAIFVDIEDVVALRDAVKEKFSDSHLAGIAASDLTVFENRAKYDAKEALEEDSPIGSLWCYKEGCAHRASAAARTHRAKFGQEEKARRNEGIDYAVFICEIRHDADSACALDKTFARFEENCKEIEFGNEDCEFVMKLCHGMSIPYESEAELAEKARNLLKEYLLVDYPGSTITLATVNGSVSDGSYCFGETLLFNLECKLQKGDSGGDRTMQNIAYYIKNLPDVIDRQLPCFLVDICGPLMSVFGIVNTGDEDAISEPLVMSFPLLFFDNEWLMVSLTLVCASLKTALQEVTNECRQFAISRRTLANTTDLDRLRFPLQDENEVIVKFAKRYGKEVHQYYSDAGFAPALLCCESLPSDWTFVVMERLPLTSLVRAEADQTMVRDQLREIRSTLAAAAFVHGDLRESNVMWDPVELRVVLVDFDWSGKDGAARYPPFMNAEIAWPSGAESGKPLRSSHDAYWLDSICRRLHFS